MAIPIGKAIQAAVRAGGYTAQAVERVSKVPKVPTVTIHLAGAVKGVQALASDVVHFNAPLMHEVETFLSRAGVPVEQGLKVLKADAASDALVLTARGLEGTGREVVIKLTDKLGIYKSMPHLTGDSLHIKEDLMSDAVQTVVKSALNGKPVLVRIEPMMQPVDNIIATLPGDRAKMMVEYTAAMRTRVNAKGLADIDLKPNNFGISRNEPPVKDFADLLSRKAKCIDVDAMCIRDPEIVAKMVNPVEYTPTYHTNPPKHVDALFAPKELPVLDTLSAVPATPQALGVGGSKMQPG